MIDARRCGAALLGLLLAGPCATAGELLVRVDPAASRITFVLGATLHKVDGTAPLPAAESGLDPDSGALRGAIIIDATALATGNERRDRKMHAEVLESGPFPSIILRPRRLRGPFDPYRGGTVVVEAELETHGARHEVRLPLRIKVDGQRATVTGSFTLPYVEWGMADPSVFLLRVAKEVLVQVDLAADLLPAPTAAPADP
jgi:polyisoprenoid-binding protein YceI